MRRHALGPLARKMERIGESVLDGGREVLVARPLDRSWRLHSRNVRVRRSACGRREYGSERIGREEEEQWMCKGVEGENGRTRRWTRSTLATTGESC